MGGVPKDADFRSEERGMLLRRRRCRPGGNDQTAAGALWPEHK